MSANTVPMAKPAHYNIAPEDFLLLVQQDLNKASKELKGVKTQKGDKEQAYIYLKTAEKKLEHLLEAVGEGPVQLRLNLESP